MIIIDGAMLDELIVQMPAAVIKRARNSKYFCDGEPKQFGMLTVK